MNSDWKKVLFISHKFYLASRKEKDFNSAKFADFLTMGLKFPALIHPTLNAPLCDCIRAKSQYYSFYQTDKCKRPYFQKP